MHVKLLSILHLCRTCTQMHLKERQSDVTLWLATVISSVILHKGVMMEFVILISSEHDEFKEQSYLVKIPTMVLCIFNSYLYV